MHMTDIAPEPAATEASEFGNRRIRERFAINCKILATPCNEYGTLLCDETIMAFGKDLSRSGISFTHDLPLTHRRFILSFDDLQFGEFILEGELIRSRMTAIGLYESGLRLLRKIVVPPRFGA